MTDWGPVWQRAPAEQIRLGAAVLVSLCLHAVVLTLQRSIPAGEIRPLKAFEASLRLASDIGTAELKAPASAEPAPAFEEPSPALIATTGRSTISAKPLPVTKALDTTSLQPMWGKPQSGSGFPVTFLVGPDGRVGEILWNQLPALTDQQLSMLEAIVRQRYYPPGLPGVRVRTVVEQLDVRGLLGLH